MAKACNVSPSAISMARNGNRQQWRKQVAGFEMAGWLPCWRLRRLANEAINNEAAMQLKAAAKAIISNNNESSMKCWPQKNINSEAVMAESVISRKRNEMKTNQSKSTQYQLAKMKK